MKLITFVCAAFLCLPSLAQEKFPDGTPVSDWFKDSKIVDINTLGKKYILTDYGVINDSTLLQTEKSNLPLMLPHKMAAESSSFPKEPI